MCAATAYGCGDGGPWVGRCCHAATAGRELFAVAAAGRGLAFSLVLRGYEDCSVNNQKPHARVSCVAEVLEPKKLG